MLRCLTGNAQFVTKAKEQEYRDQFPLHGTLTDPELIQEKKDLEDLGLTLPADWLSILVIWNRILELQGFLGGKTHV